MIRLTLVLLLALCALPMRAAQTAVDDAPGQALLVLSLHTEVALRGLRVARVDQGQRVSLGPFVAGIHLQLVALPPGRYRFESLALDGERDWIGTPAAVGRDFDLAAAALNYPGDLLISEIAGSELPNLRLSNRGARVWERLALAYPQQVRQRELRYVGGSPDPFPAFWASLPTTIGYPQAPPALPDQPGQAARDYFRARAMGDLSLSPDGRLLAMAQAQADGPLRLWLVDLDSGQRSDLGLTLRASARLQWCGQRCLSLSSGGRLPKVQILQLQQTPEWVARRLEVPANGHVIDPLPEHPQRLLFARVDDPSGRDALEVYPLNWRRGRIDPSQLAPRRQLDQQIRNEYGWVADADGQLRVALLQVDQRYQLLRTDDQGRWQTLIESSPEQIYDPIALAADGQLYALSERDHDLRALVRTNLNSGLSQTLYAHPDAELVGVVLSQDRSQVLAVRYFDHNRLHTEALQPQLRPRLAALQQRHPDASMALTQVAREGQRWLYFTDDHRHGGRWWVQDGADGEPLLLGSYRPWLDAAARYPTRSLTLQTAEGWPLQAVVVEPAPRSDGAPWPVVVMPHGGPIGVRESRLFDPQAQYLASQGMAVLKVNFRGSAGYGRRFRTAAYGAAGAAIEDDIHAALQALLADPRYDRRRVCALGSSYGGYSALMLAIRHPTLIRCVAALAPITDLPLRFSSSDWNDNALQSAFQRRLYGDPAMTLEAQMAASPVYRYAQLRAAVLLGHGELDQRVDPEHSRRLALVLARNANPAYVRWYPNEGHGLVRADNLNDWMRHAAGFIDQQLRAVDAEPAP